MSDAEVIQVPNMLKLRMGSRFGGGLNAVALAKAEAALKSLSGQFGQWLEDELKKLEGAGAAVRNLGMTQATGEALYTSAHDLKGLGTTYEYPIITRMAGLLCKLIETPDLRAKAPLRLIDVHIDAIRAAVRDNIHDVSHPTGKMIVDELEQQVTEHLSGR